MRARETSKIINSFLKVEIEYSKNILEWEGPYGWTGKTLSEIKLTKEFQIYKNFPENKDYTSESLNSVFQRVLEKYEKNQMFYLYLIKIPLDRFSINFKSK